jgi:hypothetical protein
VSAESPHRVQLRRTKGWRMPPNTVSVARPGKFGNPFRILGEDGFALIVDAGGRSHNIDDPADQATNWHNVHAQAVALFRERATDALPDLSPLRGKNLACWCPLDQPCHADVLLELANTPAQDIATAIRTLSPEPRS